jgi:hypothetical protein
LNHTIVNMHSSNDPNLSYSNFMSAFPDKHTFMANGLHGQLITVFPDLDAVAVTTAREYVQYGALIDGVIAAAKSDLGLPPNPDAAALLADAIKNAAVEKPTPVGPTPEPRGRHFGKDPQIWRGRSRIEVGDPVSDRPEPAS